jgi:hypothetical protein
MHHPSSAVVLSYRGTAQSVLYVSRGWQLQYRNHAMRSSLQNCWIQTAVTWK